MTVELTKEDCHNVRVALRMLTKAPEINEDVMMQMLNLSRKFIIVEEPKVVSEEVAE